MSIFEHENYKNYVSARIRAMPKRGHGQFRKIAEHLGIHTTMVSQIFKGPKDLTPEQAHLLAEYFGLSEFETDYLLLLVQLERASTEHFRKRLRKKIAQVKTESLRIGNRLPQSVILSESDQALFYSNWYFSAIRLMTSIETASTIDAIAEELALPKSLVAQVMEFLLKAGLCREEGGKLRLGNTRTHVDAESPLASRHHANWRMKTFERFGKTGKEELIFTSPLTISSKDFKKVREILVQSIQGVSEVVGKTEPEKLACLNIDWIELTR